MSFDLQTLRRFFFPYRSHLENEVEYLRLQLAQRQRQIDELQQSLIDIRTPKPSAPRNPPPPPSPVKPRGWRKWQQQLIGEEEAEHGSGVA